MKEIRNHLTGYLCTLALLSCSKSIDRPGGNNTNNLSPFTVSVTQRLATSATIQWTAAINGNNNDTVKYKISLNGSIIDSNLTSTQYILTSLSANPYNGRVLAYTVGGDTASAPFTINAYQAPPSPYSYVTGFYKVTETTTLISGGSPRNYVFTARATLLNDSTIQFFQSRRVPRTWWTVDFPTQIYPALNDSLIGGGITPRGRILDSNTIRMSYLYGSSVVYSVKQLWEKFANPADTATVVYSYPNVANMIKTVAGNNTSGSGSGTSGDGGLAVNASLLSPMDVVADNSGNVYFTDGSSTNYSIRKVDANGIISRFAGNNTSGFSGDGGPATAAQLNYPAGLTFDFSGNLLISDAGNRVIRRVSSSGIISTIAGIPGSYGYSGDGGQATAAQLGAPAGLCADNNGNIYFADPGKHVIRKIDANGVITTIAGTGGASGYSGDGGQATAALLNFPNDVCLDAAGNLYIADKNNHAIRKISPAGIISTIAGIGGSLNYGFTGDGGQATAAKLNNPQSVSCDASGNLYISDYTNNRIRKISTTGIISTVGGNGQSAVLGDGPDFWGGDYGPATSASIAAPWGNFWINNKLFITTSYRIRKIIF